MVPKTVELKISTTMQYEKQEGGTFCLINKVW